MFSVMMKATAVLVATLATGCADHTKEQHPAVETSATAYDGAAYAAQVQDAILDGFTVASFADACPQPAWVCAIESIESPRAGVLDVTLQPDWEQVFGEWTGPPAGVGCLKWGDQLRRNITNFTRAAGVTAPRNISVREPNGRNC